MVEADRSGLKSEFPILAGAKDRGRRCRGYADSEIKKARNASARGERVRVVLVTR